MSKPSSEQQQQQQPYTLVDGNNGGSNSEQKRLPQSSSSVSLPNQSSTSASHSALFDNRQDRFISALDQNSEEVKTAARNSSNIFRRSILKTPPLSSYNSVRDTYRFQRIQEREERAQRRYGFILNYLLIFLDIKSHYNSFLKLLQHRRALLFFVTLDFCVDFLFSILYLVELQFNFSFDNADLIDLEPRWLYVNRPAVVFYIGVWLSACNMVSMVFRTLFADNIWRAMFSWSNLLDLIICVPFISLTYINLGEFIYLPYFLLVIKAMQRLKRILRFRDEFLNFSLLTEKIVILGFTVWGLLYISLCAFNYFELYFQPTGELLKYDLVDSIYYVVITISTVGYGDISPTSVPGKFVVMVLILVSLAVVPGLITSVIDTVAEQRSGDGAYARGSAQFVVLSGVFDNVNRVMDIISVFMHVDIGDTEIKLVLLMRNDPSPAIKALLNNSVYKNRVEYFRGSGLSEDSMCRVQLKHAAASFILDAREGDPRLEDEHNTLRAWAFDEYAPQTPLYVYYILPHTEPHLSKVTTAAVCIDDLKQALMGYSCLYSGVAVLLVNLIHQTTPWASYDLVWETQYGDGSGNEIYTTEVPSILAGRTFSDVSEYLFREFQCILFAVQVYIPSVGEYHIMLNPGKTYVFKEGDVCVFIAQSRQVIEEIECITKGGFDSTYECNTESEVSGDCVSRVLNKQRTRNEFKLADGSTVNCFPTLAQDGSIIVGKPESPYDTNKVPLCHLLRHPPSEMGPSVLESASHMQNHILVCTGTYDLFKLLCTLRAAHLNREEYAPVVCLAEQLPTEDEFNCLSVFPAVYFIQGDPRKQKDLINAGLMDCQKVVIINLSTEDTGVTGDDEEFSDSSTIMISHLIYDMFRNYDTKKDVIMEVGKRDHIKFLRPSGHTHTQVAKAKPLARFGSAMRDKAIQPLQTQASKEIANDFFYHPVYSSGQVLVSGMLDLILMQTFRNSAVLEIFKLFCGLRYEKDFELDQVVGASPSYLGYVEIPDEFVGKSFLKLYRHFALQNGIIPIGLLRQGNNDGVNSWGNRLPFVYTNPLPSILLQSTDLVYILKPQ